MEINKNYNKKILIILIAIGVIAILASSYIKYIGPFAAELSERDRDPERIEKLSLIDSALTKLKDTNPDIFLGEINRVYISAPSYSANCSGLNLPSLPDEWEYRCKPETDFQKTDGTGWMPVDFTKLSDDKDNVIPNKNVILNSFQDLLPIDPANTADSGYYYAYVVGENNDWVLTSLLESDKYLKETAIKDGGSDPARIEVGSNLNIWVKVSGLVGYWNLDEGKGTTTADFSGQGNNGTLVNGLTWVDGKLGKALSFDGVDDYIDAGSKASLQLRKPYTFEAWVKADNFNDNSTIVALYEDAPNYIFLSRSYERWAFILVIEGVGTQILSDAAAQTDVWVHTVATVDSSGNMSLYINGVKQAETDTTNDLTGTGTVRIGWLGYSNPAYYFDGLIDEVRIYNQALSETEIRAIYNAIK